MLASAWMAVSQCCTRRELRSVLPGQQSLQHAEREQIDEIAAILKRLQLQGVMLERSQDEFHLEPLSTEGSLGSSEGLMSAGRTATQMETATRSRRTAQAADQAEPYEAIGCAEFTIGIKEWTEPEKQLSCNSVIHEKSWPSGIPGIHTKVADNASSPSSESIQEGVNSRCTIECTTRCSAHILSGAELMEGTTTPALRNYANAELELRSSKPQSTNCTSDTSAPSAKLENSRAGAQERQYAHFITNDDPYTEGWGLQRHFSRVRAAMSSRFARAATHALPAVKRLWHVRELDNQDDGAKSQRRLKESLFSWAPNSSLNSLGSCSWLFGSGVCQNFYSPRHQRQVPRQNLQSRSASINSTTTQRTKDNSSNGGGDLHVTFPLQVNFCAPLASPNCSNSLLEVTAIGDGTPEYFCLLGDSAGCEESPSFKRRPLVARPLGTRLQDMANLFGTVSLTGDSLGRKSHWCTVLRAATEAGMAASKGASGRPSQQKQLEHMLLLQLLQQHQRMIVLPSALNSTQQVGLCRARNLWIGIVVQGVGFEAPIAADFVAVELLKELLHRCAATRASLWVKRLDSSTAERYMIESFRAVAIELQQQQARLGGTGNSPSAGHWPDQKLQSKTASSMHTFQGMASLRKHRQLPPRRHLSMPGQSSNLSGKGPSKAQSWSRPCGFDSLTSGAVACQFLWDSEQQMLLVCHIGDVRGVLAYPTPEKLKEDLSDLQQTGERELAHFPSPTSATGTPFQHQRSFWNARQVDCSLSPLCPSYDCVVLTREHSTLDRDERKRVQGAGVFMADFASRGIGSRDEPTRRYSWESNISEQRWIDEPTPDAPAEASQVEGPSFFCPCLLTPPLTATRTLGLCGGNQFGICTSPDIACVTLERTLGFCFLLVATSSLWKIFSPQEAVDLIVAELWRQQRHHNEQQSQHHRLLKLERSCRFHVERQTDTPHHTQYQIGYPHCHTAKSHRLDHAATSSRGFSQRSKKQRGGRASTERGLAQRESMQTMQAASLQRAADVLEQRFCEEWHLKRETEPVADLGFVLLALKPPESGMPAPIAPARTAAES